MAKMSNKMIWAEMARRKVRFHGTESWDEILLWGLFSWGDVSRLIKDGRLRTAMQRENRTIWVWPTRETWEKHIRPLTERYSLPQLTTLAGWD